MTKVEPNEVCKWTQEDDETGNYNSDCGGTFSFNDNGVVENGFEFCPFCGKDVQEVKWKYEED